MRVAIHQPHFLPYPGYFHKLACADLLVVLDDAQYDKRFTNRNRVLSPNGPVWLSVPINKAHKFSPNSVVEINNSVPWQSEHWRGITHFYGKAPHFERYRSYFEAVYSRRWERLIELDLETTLQMMRWMGLSPKVVMSSELSVQGTGTGRLIEICKALGADTYVSGAGGASYMDLSAFAAEGIGVLFQRYVPRPYAQRFTREFISNLSAIDLLFNAGPSAREYLTGTLGEVAPLLSE